jgi:hypothetical protein
MTPWNILILFLGTVVYFVTLLMVFGYFGLPTKYYYVVILNYVLLTLYYYYKYSYYNLNTYLESTVKNVDSLIPSSPTIIRPSTTAT